jgi:membrane protein DedA with SNARE-associated domain
MTFSSFIIRILLLLAAAMATREIVQSHVHGPHTRLAGTLAAIAVLLLGLLVTSRGRKKK